MRCCSTGSRRFHEIVTEFGQAASVLGFQSVGSIPLVARDDDTLASRSAQMEWYDGPTLLDHLEIVDATPPVEAAGWWPMAQWPLVSRARTW